MEEFDLTTEATHGRLLDHLERWGVRDARPGLAQLGHPGGKATEIVWAASHDRAVVEEAWRHVTRDAGGQREPAALPPLGHVPNVRLRHMLIGYARVSKTDGSQSLDLQRDALRAAGIDDPANLYHDLASGVRDDRPGLDSCLRARGVGLRVLTGQGAQIDTTTAAGRLVFGILRGAGRVRAGADPGTHPPPRRSSRR